MTGIENITGRIQADAQAEIDRIDADARAQADKITAAYAARAEHPCYIDVKADTYRPHQQRADG